MLIAQLGWLLVRVLWGCVRGHEVHNFMREAYVPEPSASGETVPAHHHPEGS